MSDHAPDAIVFPPTKPAFALSRWQFSLKKAIALLAIVGLVFSSMIVPPLAAILLSLCWPICAIGLLIAAISGRGWIRPFAIGALAIQAGFAMVLLARGPLHWVGETIAFLLVMYTATIVVGLAASIMSSYLARRSGLVPVPNIPFIRTWLSN